MVHGTRDDAAPPRRGTQVRAVCISRESAGRAGLADCHGGASVLRSLWHARDGAARRTHLGRIVSGSQRPGDRRRVAGQAADARGGAANGSARHRDDLRSGDQPARGVDLQRRVIDSSTDRSVPARAGRSRHRDDDGLCMHVRRPDVRAGDRGHLRRRACR